MSSIIPREPYSADELKALYPSSLVLRQVQVFLRHGERTPITWRFANAGIPEFWPYCRHVDNLRDTVLNSNTGNFTNFQWRRHLETFASDDDDSPSLARGPLGGHRHICDYGALTDEGRRSTHALGARLRNLYVKQLGFLPDTIRDLDWMYLRATPIPRALESLQQAFLGLYPEDRRDPSLPTPTIVSRSPPRETLYPNDLHCRRLAHLARAFSKRAAARWDHTPEMEYVNSKIARYMPQDSPRVAVDSHPSLVGIFDSINSTLAHGPATRLPDAFYDPKLQEILSKIAVDEWFAGYFDSNEYRKLGIGPLLGDVVQRMVVSAEENSKGVFQASPPAPRAVKFGISGCHDTTLAATLASIGGRAALTRWPFFTSHIAFELFSTREGAEKTTPAEGQNKAVAKAAKPIGRTSSQDPDKWDPKNEEAMRGWYVRVRYNDEPVIIPGCRKPGNHLDSDVSFCTLAAFKSIVDKFTPTNWRRECYADIEAPAIPDEPETAGY